MKVLVTGATGFVGIHTAAELNASGHEVRLFVRDAAKASRVAAAIGLNSADIAVGDITDRASAAEALDGCDAMVHAAAAVALDKRRVGEILRVNRDGAQNVLGAAAEATVDRIVYVSSTSALRLRPGDPLTSSTPLADATGYAASKSAAERVARTLQQEGAHISITYPAGIIGPVVGEAMGETSTAMAAFIASGVMPTARAANSLIDVRDLARIHRLLLEADDPPARLMCGGTHLPMPALAEHLRAVTGRRFPVPPVPPVVLRFVGRTADRVGPWLGRELPINEEGMTLITHWAGTVDNIDELGIDYRPIRETLRDSIRSWRQAGLLTDRQAGTA